MRLVDVIAFASSVPESMPESMPESLPTTPQRQKFPQATAQQSRKAHWSALPKRTKRLTARPFWSSPAWRVSGSGRTGSAACALCFAQVSCGANCFHACAGRCQAHRKAQDESCGSWETSFGSVGSHSQPCLQPIAFTGAFRRGSRTARQKPKHRWCRFPKFFSNESVRMLLNTSVALLGVHADLQQPLHARAADRTRAGRLAQRLGALVAQTHVPAG